MSKISNIWAREILDSRGIPTIEAACLLDNGNIATSSVPSGASTGLHEALELRDNDPKRYMGKGVLKAIENINNRISKALIGKDPTKQDEIDNLLISLDGTENRTNLGANAILAVSEVVLKCAALSQKLNLYNWIAFLSKKYDLSIAKKIPIPLFNIINGGQHGAGNLEFQEFYIIPGSQKVYSEALRMCVEIYMTLGENLKRRGAIHSVGDEGGYAPNLFTNADALEIITESTNESGYNLGRDVFLGLDIASSYIYKNGQYIVRDRSIPMNEDTFIDFFKTLNEQYHLTILEDPLYEDSWSGWKKLTLEIGTSTTIVGDDFLVTNIKRVERAVSEKACNGLLVKPNQIGTISETLKVIQVAKKAGWKIIVSHRSGETNDWFIADFAIGVGADYVKFGGPARGERISKYNRFLTIEKELFKSV